MSALRWIDPRRLAGLCAGALLAVTAAAATTGNDTAMARLGALYAADWQSAHVLPTWSEAWMPHRQADEGMARASGQLIAKLEAEAGRYDQAVALSPFGPGGARHPGPLPDAAGWQAEEAVQAIVRLSADRRAVLINEAHHVAQTRALTLALLPRLRAAGFTHFAAETLANGEQADHALAGRGYPVRSTGVYTREPVFGEVIRAALRLGFIIVPYESDAHAQQARERGQAERLAAVLADPAARVLVHAGYAHIHEAPGAWGEDVRPMAMELARLAGTDPLTIDQTILRADTPAERENPAYRALLARAGASAFVLVDKRGHGWSLQPERYDLSVVLPDLRAGAATHGRPGWLWQLPARVPVSGFDADCGNAYPCAIEARHAGEGDDAIPADIVLLAAPADAVPALALVPGEYRLLTISADGRKLRGGALTVPPPPTEPDPARD